MTQEDICTRATIDEEIWDLFLTCFDEYGDKGIDYLVDRVTTLAKSLKDNEYKIITNSKV
jgi:hypothetical protein